MTRGLVLSLFPGIGVLDRGFEEAGFCVVRGPDKLWGGDVRAFHPPADLFDGVVGGPPCQMFSRLANLTRAQGHTPRWGNLIPEFVRVVSEAAPTWWVMENVDGCPTPHIDGYAVTRNRMNNRQLGGVQNRVHVFFYGVRGPRPRLLSFRFDALVPSEVERRVLASDGRRGNPIPWSREQLKRERLREAARCGVKPGRLMRYNTRPRTVHEALSLQGLPEDMLDNAPFTNRAKMEVIGNAVALPMARELARSIVEDAEANCRFMRPDERPPRRRTS